MTVNQAAERSVVSYLQLDRVIRVHLKVVSASDSVPSCLWFGRLIVLPSVASGIVPIPFGDGYDNDYKMVRVILQDCGIGAVTSYIIADRAGLPGHMSTAQLTEMRKRHDRDIATHASTDPTTLDEAGVRRGLETIRSSLLEHGYPEGTVHFALPMGRYNDLVLHTSQDYFTSTRTAENVPGALTLGDPPRLRVFYCGSHTTEFQIKETLAHCREHRCWTHTVLCRIDGQIDGAPESTRADGFRRLMRRVADSGLSVKAVPEIMRNRSLALA